jgi:hypothetical protein
MENYTNAIAKMLGYDTERKDALRRDYMMQKSGVQDLELQNMAGKSQNWANFMTNAANLGQAAITSQSMENSGGTGNNFLQNLMNKREVYNRPVFPQSVKQGVTTSGMSGVNRNPYILSQILPMIYGR